MSEPHTSEIARFREQQALEEESARLTLTGYAITSRHDFITARAQRGAEHILHLIDEGKHDEAQVLMNTDNWGVTDDKQDEQKISKRQVGKERRERDETLQTVEQLRLHVLTLLSPSNNL